MSSAFDEPIRIFIGVDETQRLPAKLFKYSVRRHTDAPVEFDTMDRVTWPYPKDKKNFPGTHFSFHRLAIPKLTGYQGKPSTWTPICWFCGTSANCGTRPLMEPPFCVRRRPIPASDGN